MTRVDDLKIGAIVLGMLTLVTLLCVGEYQLVRHALLTQHASADEWVKELLTWMGQ